MVARLPRATDFRWGQVKNYGQHFKFKRLSLTTDNACQWQVWQVINFGGKYPENFLDFRARRSKSVSV